MGLEETVTGDGVLIDSSSGPDSYVTTSTSTRQDGTTCTTTIKTDFTETRTINKWYGLTESAVTGYQDANPTKIAKGSLVYPVTGGWEMEVETKTRSDFYVTVSTRTEPPE